ncbi:acetoin utilization protein AcuC [Salinibacillus xinjiangensis]|uniref:Acetoin utilization protein AcuC n=1 Tax=Salinibacillus xinjiangensis TaxID=1229268 RepID=A0A6G1X9R8_9BACI|nr:acetoin utilization protein AcuC [Salinibacillus xinjiangensis]MRG87724.1 acetoin utilization protein AcuC [Salinibacillus xinjiangensis]
MNCHAAFVYSDQYAKYHFHADHPFNQKRVQLTYELLKDTGFLTDDQIIQPRMATDEDLSLIHDEKYIEAVKLANKGKLSSKKGLEFGLGTEDTPIFNCMHEAASLIVGGSLQAVDAVLQGEVKHALNLGGGLHHGFQRKASGFCIYNDGAIAIQYIRKFYNLRVLYVDTDAHHGDGVQWAFYDDPDVCTLSIHETGRYLFPGTGNVNERGLKEGYGYSFNIPIDAFTEDESFLEVYEKALRQIVEYFKPDVIVSQNGADAHVYDPLTHLCGSMQIYEAIPKLAHELAHEYCHGKWIAIGGGGYDIWRVVPRAWAQIWKVMTTNTPFTGKLPAQWLDRYQQESPVKLPQFWHDEEGFYKPIPRKSEITEKNHQNLTKSLQFIKNYQNNILNN